MATAGISRGSKRKRLKSRNLALSDVMCPVCLNILIEPVTLPCIHELCMTCFKQCIRESFFCPVCRLRISTWARKSTRKNTLVNKKRWLEIKTLFPKAVSKRLKGEEEPVTVNECSAKATLSKPGEIREEYEEELKRFQEELREQREQENKASEEFIEKLQLEEKRISERLKKKNEFIAEKDEALVKRLYQEMQKDNLDNTKFITEFLDEADAGMPDVQAVKTSSIQKKGLKTSDIPSTSVGNGLFEMF